MPMKQAGEEDERRGPLPMYRQTPGSRAQCFEAWLVFISPHRAAAGYAIGGGFSHASILGVGKAVYKTKLTENKHS